MAIRNWFHRLGDRLRGHLGTALATASVILGAGTALMWLGNEEVNHVRPRRALMSNLWFRIGVGAAVFAVAIALSALVAIVMPSRQERTDRRVKREAGDLAARIESWLQAHLAPDPLPQGGEQQTSPEKVEAHNQLWGQVALEFDDEFGADLRALRTELELEQVNASHLSASPSVPDIRRLARDLLRFSQLRGPLNRG